MILDVDNKDVFVATGGLDTDIGGGRHPSMVLIHGAGMDSSVWQLQTRYLAHRARTSGLGPVLALDLPGHGRSVGPALASVEEMAEWTASVLSHLGSKGGDSNNGNNGDGTNGPIVVGHSMGTFVALELTASHPALVGSVVLVATASAMPVNPLLMDAATNDLPLAAALMSGWSHGGSAKTAPHPSPGMAMTGSAQALIERSEPEVLATDLAACAAFDAMAAAPRLTRPVTVISGTADKMTPARAAQPLVDAFDSDLAVEQRALNCGHMTMNEAAGPLREILGEMISAK